MPEKRVKFVYRGSEAEHGVLDLYDGAKSLEGIARALAITTHALINGEVRTRADAVAGAELYIRAPQRGSFIYEATAFIADAVAAGIFYDFLKYAFNEAIGAEIDEPQSRSLRERIEPTIGELSAVLENALLDAHRPIMRDPEITLAVTRPRGEVLATFNTATGQSLQPQQRRLDDPIVGHVTRYNTISRWGRLYDRAEHRVISFLLNDDLPEGQRALITWSLHQSNLGRDGDLYLRGSAIVSPTQQRIKRYLISAVDDHPI